MSKEAERLADELEKSQFDLKRMLRKHTQKRRARSDQKSLRPSRNRGSRSKSKEKGHT